MFQFVITVNSTNNDLAYDEFKEQLEEQLNELVDEYGDDLFISQVSLSDY